MAAYFQSCSLKGADARLQHKWFTWAGHALFWGAVLSIIFDLGAVIIIIGAIFTVIAFLTMPVTVPDAPSQGTRTPSS
ncbi:MAG: DUF996 domain-containing protein [Thermoanaerobacteraceae bacterium]|nr:DUF996 domain-containing protein [Thermoanaerobacteraceae bacterium]